MTDPGQKFESRRAGGAHLQLPFLERRGFLSAAAGMTLAGTFPVFLGRTARVLGETPQQNTRTLVVVQLSGGNDGLSTVVPYSDPEYGRARTTTRIGENLVLRLNDRLGLHPNLRELQRLHDDGSLAIVQGVSYPNPTRSHFEAMDVWHSGDPRGGRIGSGWLGRAVEHLPRPELGASTALSLGPTEPLLLRGESTRALAFARPESLTWRGTRTSRKAFRELNTPGAQPGANGELDFIRRAAAGTSRWAEGIQAAAKGYSPRASYPAGNRLAQDLRLTAAIIGARLGLRVIHVSLGGFDTHAGQRPRHDQLLRNLSQALGAFVADLKAQDLFTGVTVVVFSEFGRRVRENGSQGTDHGAAAPVLVLGPTVAPGLHGDAPDLANLADGDLKMSVDFRSLYAAVLEHWLALPASKVLAGEWTPLPLFGRTAKV